MGLGENEKESSVIQFTSFQDQLSICRTGTSFPSAIHYGSVRKEGSKGGGGGGGDS